MRIVQIVLLSMLSYGFLQTIDIFKAIELNNKKDITKWLKTAKDLDIVNEDGQSVLIKAVQFKNSSLVYRLLKNGVEVDQVDSFGKTALDYTVELGNKKIAIMLIKSDARVTTKINSIKCKELINSGRGWRIFAAIALCAFVVLYFFILPIFSCVAMITCGEFLSWLSIENVVAYVIILGIGSGLTYGCVKFGKHKPYEFYRVGVI